MNYRPVILILLMLLSQAAQGMLFAQKTPTLCSSKPGVHSCCAWLMEAQDSAGCGCMASREKSKEPAPASIPASSTRDLTSPCMAIPLGDHLFLPPPATGLAGIRGQFDPRRLLSQPHVRLPVLFCSFLI